MALFTLEQLHAVFRDDNTAEWPAQWLRVAPALLQAWWASRPA